MAGYVSGNMQTPGLFYSIFIMIIKPLQDLYKGFEISGPLGSNAFSFEERKNKKIFVPSLISGTPGDLQIGGHTVFSEIEDGIEKNCKGLLHFIHFSPAGKNIFIFDNHNHAFFFWLAAYLSGDLKPGRTLVHIDQHSDMRQPETDFSVSLTDDFTLQDVFNYTNYELNVGNFISPALKLGLFSNVEIVDSSTSFEKSIPEDFVLDLDLDIFSKDMEYINYSMKYDKILACIKKSKFITIAASPYFIDQQTAIKIAKDILREYY